MLHGTKEMMQPCLACLHAISLRRQHAPRTAARKSKRGTLRQAALRARAERGRRRRSELVERSRVRGRVQE